MDITEWLNVEVDDETFGRRLKRGMTERGWSVSDAARELGVSTLSIRMSLLGIGPWGKPRDLCRTLAVSGDLTPRWKVLTDVVVLASTIVCMVPFAVGWGIRRMLRHHQRFAGGLLLVAVAVIGAMEAKEMLQPTTDEWSFRAAQVLVTAACGMLAAGWITADMFTAPNRRPYRLVGLAAMVGLPLLAFHTYVSDMYAAQASAKPAIERYQFALATIAKRTQSDHGYDATHDTYLALKDLDDSMRLRSKSLVNFETYKERQLIMTACNQLPPDARPSCMPQGIDDPLPVDKWEVTRGLFQRNVPEPPMTVTVTSNAGRPLRIPAQPHGRWDSI